MLKQPGIVQDMRGDVVDDPAKDCAAIHWSPPSSLLTRPRNPSPLVRSGLVVQLFIYLDSALGTNFYHLTYLH